MKKLAFYLLIFISVLTACSKKDAVEQIAPLNGRWLITADTVKHYENGILVSANSMLGVNSPYYQFNDNGTGSFVNGGMADGAHTFTYTVSNNIIKFDMVQPDQSIYKVTGTVKKLTQTQLVILFLGANPDFQEIMYLRR